jgi:hypothetical protein
VKAFPHLTAWIRDPETEKALGDTEKPRHRLVFTKAPKLQPEGTSYSLRALSIPRGFEKRSDQELRLSAPNLSHLPLRRRIHKTWYLPVVNIQNKRAKVCITYTENGIQTTILCLPLFIKAPAICLSRRTALANQHATRTARIEPGSGVSRAIPFSSRQSHPKTPSGIAWIGSKTGHATLLVHRLPAVLFYIPLKVHLKTPWKTSFKTDDFATRQRSSS